MYARTLAKRHVPIGPNCENCGNTASLVRHHFDYTMPLDIITLCKSCHGKIHRTPLRPDSKKRVPRLQVLDEIRRIGGWVSPIDVARSLGRPPGTVNRLCWTMARDGELVSDGHGHYALAGNVGGGAAAG